jgi:hypothetical protein
VGRGWGRGGEFLQVVAWWTEDGTGGNRGNREEARKTEEETKEGRKKRGNQGWNTDFGWGMGIFRTLFPKTSSIGKEPLLSVVLLCHPWDFPFPLLAFISVN